MSRIGKLPITIPEKVTVTVGKDNVVTVKGPLGELKQNVDTDIKINIDNGELTVTRPTDNKRHRSLHGLYRSLLNNMIVGVSKGYTVKQELVGVGYRAEAKGQLLELNLGYSHDVIIALPTEIKVETVTENALIQLLH